MALANDVVATPQAVVRRTRRRRRRATVIYVVGLCESAAGDERWTSEPVFVDDGADCFFQVSWEPATGEFQGLAINSEA